MCVGGGYRDVLGVGGVMGGVGGAEMCKWVQRCGRCRDVQVGM